MINNIIDEIKLIRRLKGGEWVKTHKRGWLRIDHYNEYIGYRFDPIVIKIENYEK